MNVRFGSLSAASRSGQERPQNKGVEAIRSANRLLGKTSIASPDLFLLSPVHLSDGGGLRPCYRIDKLQNVVSQPLSTLGEPKH